MSCDSCCPLLQDHPGRVEGHCFRFYQWRIYANSQNLQESHSCTTTDGTQDRLGLRSERNRRARRLRHWAYFVLDSSAMDE